MAKGVKTGGRQKGTPNKVTIQLKQALLNTLDEVGGEDYLKRVALEDMRTFCSLLGKVLPTQITGDKDNPLEHVHEIRRTIVRP